MKLASQSEIRDHSLIMLQLEQQIASGTKNATDLLALGTIEPRASLAAIFPAIQVAVATMKMNLEVINFDKKTQIIT